MKRFTKLLSGLICVTLLFTSCAKEDEIEVTENSETTAEVTEVEEEETTCDTPTPTTRDNAPTRRPTNTLTPTEDPELLIYEGDGVCNPIPAMSFDSMPVDSSLSQEEQLLGYFNSVLVPQLGIKTNDEFYVNSTHRFVMEDGTTGGVVGNVNMLNSADGIFGKYIADFDSDGVLDMVVLGLAKGTVNSNLVSYYYRPYMLLCSISDASVQVTDILFISNEAHPEDDADNGALFQYNYDPSVFTSSNTSAFYFLTRLVNTGSEVQIQGYVSSIESCIGDGSFEFAWELHVADGKFSYITFCSQNGWGSADFTYTIYPCVNGVLSESQTETFMEDMMVTYLGRLNWGLRSSSGELAWSTVNVGIAYSYGSFFDGDDGNWYRNMVFDVVNR